MRVREPTPVRDLSALAADLAATAFGEGRPVQERRIGAETELIPIEAATGRMLALDVDAPDGEGSLPSLAPETPAVSSLGLLRRVGGERGWREQRSAEGGGAIFHPPAGGHFSFEPGGQLEYSSPPCRSASALLRQLRDVVEPLRAAARDEGIDLLAVGLEPHLPVGHAPLQLFNERYCRMADYFSMLGVAGARMMRQTASFQVNLDLGDNWRARWRVLNAAAPYVTAIFAKSPLYAGHPTGHQSYRAHIWRTLDSSRTGLPYRDGAPIAAYLEFALAAPDLMRRSAAGEYLPFVGWLSRGQATLERWRTHLTTLFPEVRPRGYFEIRSIDALPVEWYAAPIALMAGITYDPATLAAASELLGTPDSSLLARAGRLGLHDPAIAGVARDLTELALCGCAALGEEFLDPADREQAREFFERFTRRGRSPADETLERVDKT